MVATKTIVIAGVITVICVTALVVGIVLGTRSYGCSISEPPTEVTVTHSATGTTISWAIPEGEEECEGAYRLGYEIDDGASVRQNFTDLEELSWTIDPLEPCSVLHVHIWPITKDGEVMSEHFMEDFSVPLENLAAPTNVQINEGEGGLEVIWNAPANVGNCADEIQYEVTVVRDGESSTEDPSSATSYSIEDSSYCFEVTVSIVAIHEDESSSAASGTFQAPPIENIATLQSTDDPTQLVISWDPHPKADICGIEYRVVYRRGGQEFVVTAETATLSIELDYCVETELSVAAFNGEHSTEVGSSSGIIYPTQIDALTDLAITEGVISWTAPAVPETCTVAYVLNFDTDARQAQFNTIETTFAVPDDIYCFRYFVQVVPVLGEQSGIGEDFLHTDEFGVQNLDVQTSTTNPDQLIATWSAHPKEEQCALQYSVSYIVDGTSEFSNDISETTINFDRLYCIEAIVSVIATNGATNSQATRVSVEAEDPAEIGSVSNVEIVDGVVTWTPRSALRECSVLYVLNINADNGGEGQYITPDASILIPSTAYCFSFVVGIYTVLGETGGATSFESYTDDSKVEDLQVQPSETNTDKLVATWTAHPKQTQCDLQYEFKYTTEGTVRSSEVVSELTAIFDKVYCAEGVVSVIATNANGVRSGEAIEPVAAQSPTDVGSVSDVEINDGVITWSPVSNTLESCTVIYTLKIVSDSDNYQPQTQDTTYSVPDSDYCFGFDVEIYASVGDTIGPSDSQTYTDGSPLQNLQIETSSENSEQLTATWDTHPKESQCSLRYEITYTTDGTSETWEELENTATFDKTYCVQGVLSVTAINDNGARSDPAAEVVEEEDPTEIGTVSNVEIIDGLVTWTPIAALGRCSVNYVLNVNADSGNVQYTTTDTPYLIPSTDYCFSFGVGITAVVGSSSGGSVFQNYRDDSGLENLQVVTSGIDNDQLVASWTAHPKETQCSLQYEFTYTIGGNVISSEDLSVSTITFDKVYCAEGVVTVIASNGVDFTSAQTNVVVEAESPATVDAVFNVVKDGEAITWDPVSVPERCTVAYVLNTNTDSGPGQYQTTETSFIIPSADYCFMFIANILAIVGETSSTPVEISFTDGSPVQNLQVETSSENSEQLTATWDTHPKESQCSLRYEITYTTDGTSETWEELENTATFDKTYCVQGVLSVTAINDNGARSDPAPEVVEEEDPTEIGTVSNVEVIDGLVTWTPIAALGRCSVNYVLNVNADSGNVQYTTTDTPYLIPSTDYCFSFGVAITAVVGSSSGGSVFQNYRDDSGLENLQVVTSGIDNDQLVASWTAHPKETQCSLQYEFTYTIGGNVISSEDLSVSTITFDKVYCAEGVVTVIASNGVDFTSAQTNVVVEAESPATVDAVFNVVKDGEAITWDPVSVPERCTVAYVLNTNTDSGPGQYQTTETSFIIPSADYCFMFIANILAVVGETSSTPVEISFTDGSPVQNLQVETSSENSEQLTATWDTHPKESQCSLRYEITYTTDGTSETWEELENTATFDKTYCVQGVLSVTAINDNGARSDPAPEVVEEEDPTEIGTVSNVEVIDGLVTWTPVAALGRCSVNYVLNVNADSGNVQYTTTDTSYLIPSTDYCFSFGVGITAVVGSSSGGSVVQDYRDGSGLENLQVVTSGIDNDQLVASWTAHPKETQCSLQYEFTYTIGGNVISSEDLSGSTITFDKVYCAEGVVTVIASNGVDFTSAQTNVVVEAESPATVDAVFNVVKNGEAITWDPVSVPERCTVAYVLNTNTDSGPGQYQTTETSFIIPSADYCFMFIANILAVVGETSSTPVEISFTDDSGVGILQVETIGEQLTATWDAHPKATQCSLQYALTYSVDGVVQHTDLVSENTVSFNRFFCVEGEVSVVATNSIDLNSSPSTATVEADYPSNVDPVTNLESNDGYLTWISISAPLGCDVTYILELTGDLGEQDYDTVDNIFTIPPADYCFEANVNVIAVIGEIRSTPAAVNIDAALQVETVTVIPVLDDNEILVSWPVHSKQDQCGITYDATYSYGSMENQAPIRNNQETAAFSLGYCVEGTVTVTAVASVVPVTTSNTGAHISVTPTAIGQVQDLAVVSTPDNEIAVSWNPPLYVGQCGNIEYEVTATDREIPADTNSCTPTTDSTSCIVTEYCPTTDITVIATYIDTIVGEEATHEYTCDSSSEQENNNTI